MTQKAETVLAASYANFLVVGHNAFEFILDFGQGYLGGDPRIHTRVVTAPVYAKAMLETLRASIGRFEVEHGAIPDLRETEHDGEE